MDRLYRGESSLVGARKGCSRARGTDMEEGARKADGEKERAALRGSKQQRRMPEEVKDVPEVARSVWQLRRSADDS